MLSQGIIEESWNAWSSPIFLVQKKDVNYRCCIDFRQLNAVTKKDAYPIPNISSILDQLRNAKYLSSLDIKIVYFQIPLSPEFKEFTACTVPDLGLILQKCHLVSPTLQIPGKELLPQSLLTSILRFCISWRSSHFLSRFWVTSWNLKNSARSFNWLA